MRFPRSAGLLLHPTSLPGPGGIGDLGPDAHRLLDVMAQAGLTIWQMLPLGPTGYGDSPYQCFSAFAGNPLLVALPPDPDAPAFPTDAVDFERVIPYRKARLRERALAFRPTEAYRRFVATEAWWLDDYALFMACKDAHGGVAWPDWAPALARRESGALAEWGTRLAAEVERYKVEQYFFFSQFNALRKAAADRGIRLMGDLPIYVAHDSADVWASPQEFKLTAEGRPLVQAGVPPDYFSATGQLWGNPIYDWDAMARDGFRWWIRRVKSAFELFDLVRIDHFRGFEAYWEVPGTDTTAEHGRWVPAPGHALFTAIRDALGDLPIVAENLGVITPAVEQLREAFGFPGMRILQFAFGTDPQASAFRPHAYEPATVVYTGTHDNDTTVGWWRSDGAGDSTRASEEVAAEKAFAARYLGLREGDAIEWAMIRTALASVADTVIVPMQDILGLGSAARFNLPGRAGGNWRFRFTWDQCTPALTQRLRTLVDTFDR